MAPKLSSSSLVLPVAFGLAVLFAVSNAYVGLSSGVTPNMSVVGILVAATILYRKKSQTNAASDLSAPTALNLSQTIASAGNAVAASLIFTLPILFLTQENFDLSWGFLWQLGFVVAGGISFAVLVVAFLVGSTKPQTLHETDAASEGPEAKAIRSLITEFTSSSSQGSQHFSGAIALAVLGGVLGGALGGLDRSSGTLSLNLDFIRDGSQITLSMNPSLIALGSLIGVTVARGLFAGSLLSTILLLGLWRLNVADSPVSESVNDPVNQKATINTAAAFLLGLASCTEIFKLFLKLVRARKKPRQRTIHSLTHCRKLAGWVAWPAVISAFAAMVVIGRQVQLDSAKEDVFAALMIAVFAAGAAAILAERVATIVGVSTNPSSAMSLLVGACLTLVLGSVSGSPLLVMVTCFVVASASASADLAQDLITGRQLKTPAYKQVQLKWTASLAAIPLTLVFLKGFLPDVFSTTDTSSAIQSISEIPQATALHRLVEQIELGRISGAALSAMSVLLLFACYAWKAHPILLGIGMIMSTQATLPLMAGAGFAKFLKGRQEQGSVPGAQPSPMKLEAAMAAALGSYSIGYFMTAFWNIHLSMPEHLNHVLTGGAASAVLYSAYKSSK